MKTKVISSERLVKGYLEKELGEVQENDPEKKTLDLEKVKTAKATERIMFSGMKIFSTDATTDMLEKDIVNDKYRVLLQDKVDDKKE